jgi:hypothetical protein
MVDRLDNLLPKLSKILSTLSFSARKTLILSLCKNALNEAGLDESILSLIQIAELENLVSIEIEAQEIAEKFDEKYFYLNEKEVKSKQDEADELRFFTLARIASALTHIQKLDRLSEAKEGLYEALMAADDPNKASHDLLISLET